MCLQLFASGRTQHVAIVCCSYYDRGMYGSRGIEGENIISRDRLCLGSRADAVTCLLQNSPPNLTLRFSPQITVNSVLPPPHDHPLPLPSAFSSSLPLLRTLTCTSNFTSHPWSTFTDITAYASDIKSQRWSVLLRSFSVRGTSTHIMVARA